MHNKRKWRIVYHYKEDPATLYAEATGENAQEALQTFYRNHESPENIIVTSCKAAKE